jgi:Holliday junction resolvasome RuvABC endonuclease subunit
LGIDPGLLHTGWAVIDVAGSNRRYVASGVILPPTKIPLPERLAFIFNGINDICENFQPTECSIEIIFVNKNSKTTLLLGHARAAAITALAAHRPAQKEIMKSHTILLHKILHPWTSFTFWQCVAPVNAALLRLPSFRFVRTKNPSQIC